MAKKKPGIGYHIIFWVLPPILAVIATLFRLSWRVRGLQVGEYRRGRDLFRAPGNVFAVWHQRILPFLRPIRKTSTTLLVSLSPDGEIMTSFMRMLGHGVVRGSSTRGAAAGLRGMTEARRDGRTIAFTADGPKGPIFEAKLGPIAAARDSGAGAVIPTSCAAWPTIRLRSWDGLQIPLPFAKVVFAFGEPIAVPADADREQMEACRLELERSLAELTAACDDAMGIDRARATEHVKVRSGDEVPA